MIARITLTVAGLAALVVGAAQLLAPVGFHELSGLPAVTDPGSLSEARAVGAGIVAAGAGILAGALRPALTRVSAMVGAGFYLAFGVGRVVGVAVDGVPPGGLVGALVTEVVLGLACGVVVLRSRGTR
ncbi:DUF4345 family protein [Actinokineospora cianjurensis]|uniref:Uncharacterized protein DUF4345 n=1 Tax=Actinokineospora cianjurensis TaxID=585224 RepID=A0A421AYI6_9PSEU|nr:DUF4345 family protein [Actinokineospora cianjurensis]RLK54923.1 uncharacterized protein DUF4345 [Actinokineospora cianjurensis]